MESPAVSGVYLQFLDCGSLRLAYCPETGGVFFDIGRLDELLESRMPVIGRLLELPHNPLYQRDCNEQLLCPRHPMVGMNRRVFEVDPAIYFEECPECGSIWLERLQYLELRRQVMDQAPSPEQLPAFCEKLMTHTEAYRSEHELRDYFAALSAPGNPEDKPDNPGDWPHQPPMRYWPVVFRVLFGWPWP